MLFTPTQAIAAIVAGLLLTNIGFAHFPWLVRTEEGKAAYFFGETVADRTYHLPDSIAKAEVKLHHQGDQPQGLKLVAVDEEAFVGLVSKAQVPATARLTSHVTYGVYHGSRLDYYTQYEGDKLPTSREAYSKDEAPLRFNAQLVDVDAGVDVYITWNGQPLAGADVQLYCADGDEEGSSKTDAAGKVSFTDEQLEEGLNAILAGFSAKDQAGKFEGQGYESESHYLTVTFVAPDESGDTQPAPSDVSNSRVDLAELPFAITSFGAACVGDAIYVYGGHVGEAHSYSTEEQSNQLLKLELNGDAQAWEKVAEGQRLQGLALVTHGEDLIVIGGFTALNEKGADHDLHSQAKVHVWDTASNNWSELPALPAGRSSHDAAILGDTIYVVGGWNMDGDKETQWHSDALALDLSQANPQWTEIAAPPFERRALAVVAHADKIYAIGGMGHEGGPTRAVSVYDPQANTWNEGPELVGEKGMEGFGASAWSIDEKLIATTYSGKIQLLSSDGSQWTVVGETQDARFFNRLLPYAEHALVSIGGANMEAHEKYVEPEVISID